MKQVKLTEIKGSGYKVDGVEFGSYIPNGELEDMQPKVDKIWAKMNDSEKFGCSMAMFPIWVKDYNLTHTEIVELMGKK